MSKTRLFDFAVFAGYKRQSQRTFFVHIEDATPIYENFCFAFALFRQRTTESVTAGKELIDRLLAFQTEGGNFPIFLHEYPRCFDFHMPLKVAPILIYLLRFFSAVLGDLKLKITESLKKILAKRPEKPFWENRYRACLGEPIVELSTTDFSAADWTHWLITAQLAGQTHFVLPYKEELQLFLTKTDMQEKGEPQPHPIEWLLAEGHYSSRLLRDHPHQLLCAPLFPITFEPLPIVDSSCRLFWRGSTLHSLVAVPNNGTLTFDLPAVVEMSKGDLFEVAFFTDISPETEIFVEGRKATFFRLGETVTVKTPTLTIDLQFELTQGTGDFCGHICRANRPSQIAGKGTFEVYDWQIGIRTLRRSSPAQIKVQLVLCY